MSCTEILRPAAEERLPFWPLGRGRLSLIFKIENGKFTGQGFDPDASNTAPVFTAELRSDQESGFLEAVREGVQGVEVTGPSNDNLPVDSSGGAQTNTVVVSDPGNDGKGPKFWQVMLPAAVRATKTARPTGT